jgi:glycosyltransferase involved in cell wall biosynthesis
MVNLPVLSILIPTYKRPQTLYETVRRLSLYLKYSGPIQLLIGDDSPAGSEEQYHTFETVGTLAGHDDTWKMHYIRGPGLGLAANMNNLLEFASGVLLMSMDDDHWLHGDLNLDVHAEALLRNTWLGYIRLMGVTGHEYLAELREARLRTGAAGYWLIDWNSPELYIPSFRPNLRTAGWHTAYGKYPVYDWQGQQLKLGDCEEAWCHRCKDAGRADANLPRVGVPVNLDESIWTHVGISWQKEGL